MIKKKPLVTVWVAARNEENNILNCLNSLKNQNFEISNYEVLVGNDSSTDQTAKIVTTFCEKNKNFKLIEVNKVINNQRGKANVLANLYENSHGNYFLITDADVVVGPNWINGMINNFEKDKSIGHQVGVTSISGNGVFQMLQALDWLWALTLLKLASLFNIPLTGLGNNSGLTRQAYEATGGYAKIPFSITEDFALFHEVFKKKFNFHNAINSLVFAKTIGMGTFKEFLHQRKRWMVGALQCPAWVVLFLYIQGFFMLLYLFILAKYGIEWAFILFLIKSVLQFFIVLPSIYVLKEFRLIFVFPLYEAYFSIWTFLMIFFYYLPFKIDWKGREYTA